MGRATPLLLASKMEEISPDVGVRTLVDVVGAVGKFTSCHYCCNVFVHLNTSFGLNHVFKYLTFTFIG